MGIVYDIRLCLKYIAFGRMHAWTINISLTILAAKKLPALFINLRGVTILIDLIFKM